MALEVKIVVTSGGASIDWEGQYGVGTKETFWVYL